MKDEKFQELLQREGIALATPQAIPRKSGRREGEASFAQQRMWISQRIAPESRVYNILLALSIDGNLSYPAVTQILETIVSRHEALRTSFKVVDGRPFQIIRPTVAVPVNYVDIAGMDKQHELLRAILACKQSTSFGLEQGPLFDFTIVRTGDSSNVLLLALHHIIFDFVSSQILFEEFSHLYSRYVSGLPGKLPELRIQNLDYSEQQRVQFEQSRAAETLQYWKERLGTGDEIPAVELEGDQGPVREAAFLPAVEKFVVPDDLVRRVRSLSIDAGVSRFIVWLVGFHMLLHRYSGTEDVLVCVPQAERNHQDLERLIGFFVNFVPIKLHIGRRQSFRELLHSIHQEYLDATGPRAYPFEKLVEILSPRRHERGARLGKIGFGYQHSNRSTWNIGALRIRFLEPDMPISKSELALSVYEDSHGCRGYLEYDASKFSGEMIREMADHYCNLLLLLLESSDQPVGSIACNGAEGSDQTADQSLNPPSYDCLYQPVKEQARIAPDATALVMGDVHLTYGALNGRAIQFARHLAGRYSVSPGSAVALYLPRTLDAYISILAILKTGAAYVPIDRSHPAAYVSKMLASTDVTHLLVADEKDKLCSLLENGTVRVIDLPALAKAGHEKNHEPPLPVSGEHTAYICFTSGSTGENKGISVTHRAITPHIHSFGEKVGITKADRVLQFAALTFDVSLEQIFSTWAAGATLLPRGEDVWSIREFVDFLSREQISIANLPTAYWNQVVGTCATSLALPAIAALRCMIAGGEAMLWETACRWRQVWGGDVRLINAYGPTESVITATLHDFDDATPRTGPSVPIGRVFPGRRAYVLDPQGLPVPSGTAGELCLAGVALADGYLKNPRATAAAFWPEPQFGLPGKKSKGARIYRTGDLVRRLRDGSLQYLHRNDDQVKIRGMRVTPAFVESVVVDHPLMLEAAVVARDTNHNPANFRVLSDAGDAEWRVLLEQLPEGIIERSIYEIESGDEDDLAQTADDDSLRLVKHTPEFDVSLQIKESDFIATARSAQRNWVLNRALDECASDLRELHALSQRFVAGSDRVEIAGDLSFARPEYMNGELVINGQQVMQDWQKPLMRALAKAVTEQGGDILEIGFGMGISANYIHESRVRSHVIIESNEAVCEAARRWRAKCPHAKIKILHGRWQDVIDDLEQFDGIFFDTYPTTEAEFRRYIVGDSTFAAHFFPVAAKHLKDGGVFTYYSNEIDCLSRRHQRLLLQSFSSFEVSVVRGLQPPPQSQNWWADSMAVVRAWKSRSLAAARFRPGEDTLEELKVPQQVRCS
jgi:amino acid adenylation domain-containing protein